MGGRLASLLLDFQEAGRQYRAVESAPTVALFQSVQLDRDIAQTMARLHDIGGAQARLDHPRFALAWQVKLDELQLLQGRVFAAYVAEDYPSVLALAPAFRAVSERFNGAPGGAIVLVGVARAMTGDRLGTREILDTLPPDSDPDTLSKGRALLAVGDVAGADKLFALVATRAPSVGFGPFWRRRWRVEHGQPGAALPFLAEAKRRVPRWSDPLKYEGDALAALGRWSQAEAAYAKAEPFAPKWGALHLKWGEALAKLGKARPASSGARRRPWTCRRQIGRGSASCWCDRLKSALGRERSRPRPPQADVPRDRPTPDAPEFRNGWGADASAQCSPS